MMTGDEFQGFLGCLGISQTYAARLLSVSPRTVSRWPEETAEIPGPAELALRTWLRPQQLGLAWHPHDITIGEGDLVKLPRKLLVIGITLPTSN